MSLLAQQLRQLEVPQIKALLGKDTRKPSFLFDAKEAASIDRETFFAIGMKFLWHTFSVVFCIQLHLVLSLILSEIVLQTTNNFMLFYN